MKPRTAFLYHPIFLEHKTGRGHPESPQRLSAIIQHLESRGVLQETLRLTPTPAPLEAVTRIHDPAYVRSVAEHAGSGGLFQEDADTVGSPATYDAALHAAGAVLNAVDAVMEGRAANAFCAVRPPGHHAERDRAMGFCFFNNVAIAARHLRDRHRLRRIAILDWDVHHGNGTQNAFYADPGVFYFSVHQFPHYPGTGRRSERGIAGGAGFTLNVPLRAGSGDEDYRRVFSGELRPAMDNFRPDFILISAGFDAHRDDPLSEMLLTEAGFRDLTDAVLDMAARYAEDRIVSVLEGGYNLDAAAASVEAHLRSLMRA